MKLRSQQKGTRKGRKPSFPAQPPMLSANVKVRHVYRFTSATGTATAITDRNICQIIGGMCTVANTTLKGLSNAAKLHRISIWAPPASQGASVTCSILWNSGSFAPDIEVSDSTNSTAVPARLSTRPPPGSSASFWMGETASNTMFTITAPAGSIIDVDVTHLLADTQAALTSYGVAAGTLGAYYYLPLDGTGDQFLPVSLGTTT